jgi:hypothetical protein
MSNETVAALCTIAVVGFALFILALLLAVPAGTREVCLSKSEARELFPRAHLYWYSRHHCWSNRRGPPRGLRLDPVIEPIPKRAKEVMPDEAERLHSLGLPDNKKEPRVSGAIKEVHPSEYNELDAAADQEPFSKAEPFQLWRSISVPDPYDFASAWAERVEHAWRTPR